jgi:hypothetical protein
MEYQALMEQFAEVPCEALADGEGSHASNS